MSKSKRGSSSSTESLQVGLHILAAGLLIGARNIHGWLAKKIVCKQMIEITENCKVIVSTCRVSRVVFAH